ncbi:MAG: hypothetical protein ACK5DD_07720 [Cyclobacteriaceae bacterium]
MKKRLSSRLTWVYKFGFPLIWAVWISLFAVTIFFESNEKSTLIILIMILAAVPFLTLKSVSFDDDLLYVTGFRGTKVFSILEIRSIDKGNLVGLKPFWSIQIQDQSHKIKIKFIPKLNEELTTLWNEESQWTENTPGNLGEFAYLVNNKKNRQ